MDLRNLFCVGLIASLITFSGGRCVAQQDSIFFEDFSGPKLNSALEVHNADPKLMGFVGGNYLKITTRRERVRQDRRNIIQYKQMLPENFIITLRVEEAHLSRKQKLRIRIGEMLSGIRLIYSTKKDGVDYFTIEKVFVLEGGAGLQGIVRVESGLVQGQPFYMRIKREGNIYLGEYSQDGHSWSRVGKQRWKIDGYDQPKEIDPIAHLEVINSGDAPETSVIIDSLEVIGLSE